MRIKLDTIVKTYGTLRALSGVNVEFEPGQIVALLGVNGAGKTTLMRCMAGVCVPDSGRVLYDDEWFHRDRMDLRKRFVFLPDFPPLLPNGNLIRHISMALKLYGVDWQKETERIVEQLGEFELLNFALFPVETLSRGQSYKAALATLLAVDPDLWLLDEPFASGMDPVGISAFRKRAREAASRGKTVVYSTQLLELAEMFSDRVVVIHKGQVAAFGTMADLRQRVGRGEGDTQGGVLEELFHKLREENA